MAAFHPAAPPTEEEPSDEPSYKTVEEAAAAARAFLAASDFEGAVVARAQALELVMEAEGEGSLPAAHAHAEYATALLRKVQAEADPLGAGFKKKDEGGGGGGGGGGGSSEAGPSAPAAEAEDVGEEGDGEEEDGDDLQIAFECFEIARLAYEAAPAGQELRLSDVLEGLAEVQMENEMWEAAIADLGSALALKQAALPPHDRALAMLHFQLGVATVAQLEKCKSDADEAAAAPGGAGGSAAAPANLDALSRQAKAHYEAAAAVLQKRVEFLEAPPADGVAAAAAEDNAKELADGGYQRSELKAAGFPPWVLKS